MMAPAMRIARDLYNDATPRVVAVPRRSCPLRFAGTAIADVVDPTAGVLHSKYEAAAQRQAAPWRRGTGLFQVLRARSYVVTSCQNQIDRAWWLAAILEH